jgi:type IV pilus assembly protein PilA
MQNPYSHAPSGAATPEQQKQSDYELAVGQNAEYYLPKFEQYDNGGSKLGWNWPAFFVTTPWFLYRKMWGWGMANLAWFWGVLTFVGPVGMGIAAGAAGKGNEMGAIGVVATVVGLLLIAPWILLPMFANALYWKHVNKVIRNVPASFASQPDKRQARIERNGGTGAGAMIGVLIGGAFVMFAFVGILAAIAIPAYQDYTIRGQVAEGLSLAAAPKAAVAEFYAQNEGWPENGEAAGITDSISGKYVDSITVENGSIVIVYGGQSNVNLKGKTLFLMPGVDDQKSIAWMCADGAKPDWVERGPGRYGTDIPSKYLPAACRPT